MVLLWRSEYLFTTDIHSSYSQRLFSLGILQDNGPGPAIPCGLLSQKVFVATTTITTTIKRQER